jgi:hypothetical protein
MSFLPIIVHVQHAVCQQNSLWLQLDQKLRSMGFGCCTPLERTGLGALRCLEFLLPLGDVSIFEQSAAWARRMSECPRMVEVNKEESGFAQLYALDYV